MCGLLNDTQHFLTWRSCALLDGAVWCCVLLCITTLKIPVKMMMLPRNISAHNSTKGSCARHWWVFVRLHRLGTSASLTLWSRRGIARRCFAPLCSADSTQRSSTSPVDVHYSHCLDGQRQNQMCLEVLGDSYLCRCSPGPCPLGCWLVIASRRRSNKLTGAVNCSSLALLF